MTSQPPSDPNMPPPGGFRPEDRTPAEAYQAPESHSGAARGEKSWGWILAIIAVVLIGGLVVCCGALYWGFQVGADQMTSEVQEEIADHPAIEEHIGEIESLDLSLRKTGELGEKGRVVLTVEGTKGDGLIIGSQEPGSQQLTDLVLETPDGEQYPLEE